MPLLIRPDMTVTIKHIILFGIAAFIVTSAAARENRKMAYRGFIGGMMLHSGYVQSGSFQVTSHSGAAHDITMAGAPHGIGGSIRFMFGNHLRVGAEGYVSNLVYGEHRSHAETGWGGILADCAWHLKGCSIFAGGTIGGGSQTNTIIITSTGNDYNTDDIAYRKFGFMALAPFAGVEICLTSKVNLTLKADWLLNLSNRQDDFTSGPRIYVGVMFGHRK